MNDRETSGIRKKLPCEQRPRSIGVLFGMGMVMAMVMVAVMVTMVMTMMFMMVMMILFVVVAVVMIMMARRRLRRLSTVQTWGNDGHAPGGRLPGPTAHIVKGLRRRPSSRQRSTGVRGLRASSAMCLVSRRGSSVVMIGIFVLGVCVESTAGNRRL